MLNDNTNVSLRELSETVLYESARSEHRKECCAKGGNACQPCGFDKGMHLTTGACPDSLHIKIVKTLEQQEEFQKYYLDGTEIKRMFINTFDKGYRLSIEAAHLNQVCLQPHFAKSDSQFSRHKLLSSGAVSYLRSGNERNVKQMKRLRIAQQGIPSVNFDLTRLDNIWIAWGFQVNFMHQPCV